MKTPKILGKFTETLINAKPAKVLSDLGKNDMVQIIDHATDPHIKSWVGFRPKEDAKGMIP